MTIPARLDYYKTVPVPFFIDQNNRFITFHKNIAWAFKADGTMKPERPNPGDFKCPFTWEVTIEIDGVEKKEMMTDEYGIVLLAFIMLENPEEFLQWFNRILTDSRRDPRISQGYLNKTWPIYIQREFARVAGLKHEELFKTR